MNKTPDLGLRLGCKLNGAKVFWTPISVGRGLSPLNVEVVEETWHALP